jgi:NADH:ubiquinone oxidoreductase subunit 5 (subunit L)/multisubunit Na+/H+ antiporter MnhA subunit
MSEKAAHSLAWIALVGAMLLGAIVVLCSFVWLPAYEAASVDVILSPGELREPKLVEVVHRTHKHNAHHEAVVLAPYAPLGIMIVAVAAAGMIGVRRWHPREPE